MVHGYLASSDRSDTTFSLGARARTHTFSDGSVIKMKFLKKKPVASPPPVMDTAQRGPS